MSEDHALRRPALPGSLLIRSLERQRSRPVLHHGEAVWTAAAVADEISRYVQAWRAWGMKEGSRVAILSANRPEAVLCLGAALVAGVVWTPLHPLGSLEDQAFVLDDAGVSTLLFDPAGFSERAHELMQRVPSIDRIVALGATSDAEDLTTAARAFGARRLQAPDVQGSDTAWLVYTGGTTGRPKGTLLSHDNIGVMTQIQLAEWDWAQDVRLLCATPLSHAAGTLVLPSILRGGSIAVLRSFDPDEFIDAVSRLGITTTLLVPTMIYRLLDHPEFTRERLSSLQTLIYGASAMSPTRLADGLERLGQVFFQIYGQTECPTTVAVLRKAEHALDRADRLMSCGRPVPWLDVALLDDDGDEVPAGTPGELCVRGPLVMSGYHLRPQETDEALREGWLHTGDVATADHEGYLTIVDRKKDLIVTGGFNVFPREVEDVLSSHPGVSVAAVIGVPHETWGEAVTAVVVRRPDAEVTARELVQLVRDRKGPAAAPKSVEFVDAMPLSALGKPDKKALRSEYWSGLDRSVN